MKRMMSIAAIALFVAGSSALACDTCGCKAKKDAKKCAEGCAKECCAPKAEDKEAKKCAEGCTKECCAPKAEAEAKE